MPAILLNSVLVAVLVNGVVGDATVGRGVVGGAALRAADVVGDAACGRSIVDAANQRQAWATTRISNDKDPQRSVAELTEMQHQIARAVVTGDREGWSRFIDPEWRVTHVDGSVLTKAQVLEMVFGKTPGPLAENSVDEIEVRVFGDAAVVTGRTRAQSREGVRVVLRFTDFVVQRGGRWQVVASQATAVKQTP
jgi:hypothetical protein